MAAMPRNVRALVRSKIEALADMASVSKPYLSEIEGGKRTGTAATLKKLARALGVPMDVLQP